MLLLAIVGSILLPACLTSGGDGGSSVSATASPDPGAPQMLPLEDARLASTALKIMITRSEAEKATGLMFRREMDPNEGMLFVYDRPQVMVFWMKNTILPLDLVLFGSDLRMTEVIEGMKPGIGIPDELQPRYVSRGPAQYALELNAGSASRLGLKVGDQLEIPLPLLFSNRR